MKVLSVSYKSPQAAALFTQSLRETGFGVITDHPIAPELVSGVFAEWAEFFRSEQKHRYTFKAEEQAGYFPFRSENAKDSPVKDLKEFFHLYPWNALPEGMSQRTRELFDQMTALAAEMLGWIEDHTPEEIRRNFDVPLRQSIEGSQEILLRPILYPPLTGGEEQGAIRAAAHEDINLITLLLGAEVGGLEIQDRQGNWLPVIPPPGALAINVGDMLQRLTNYCLRSTRHRVVNPPPERRGAARYSMPFFLHLRPDFLIDALPQCVDTDHPRRDAPITAHDYLIERLREIGLVKG